MAQLELNLYDMNKQIMNGKTPLCNKSIVDEMAGIAAWFSYEVNSRYFMLLCHERRDYTIFHFTSVAKRCYEGSIELREALENRGQILNIEYEKDCYAIWLKIEDESFLYHLFPYDEGVIEV